MHARISASVAGFRPIVWADVYPVPTTTLIRPGGGLLHGLDRAGEHRSVAGEGIGHRRKQRQGRRVGRRKRHRDERVAAEQLAVEDPGAVEAGSLDVLDQLDQLRHRCRARNPKRDLNARHGMGIPFKPVGRLRTYGLSSGMLLVSGALGNDCSQAWMSARSALDRIASWYGGIAPRVLRTNDESASSGIGSGASFGPAIPPCAAKPWHCQQPCFTYAALPFSADPAAAAIWLKARPATASASRRTNHIRLLPVIAAASTR